MGFFSKLFKKKNLKEETRTVTNEVPQEVKVEPKKEKFNPTNADYNWMLAAHLNDAMTAGKMKRYQNVVKFCDAVANQPIPRECFNVDKIKVTPEIEALRKVWVRLKCKCSDEVLMKYMTE